MATFSNQVITSHALTMSWLPFTHLELWFAKQTIICLEFAISSTNLTFSHTNKKKQRLRIVQNIYYPKKEKLLENL